MARPPTDARTSSRMSRQRRRDTQPELRLRQLLHAAGYRYRVDVEVDGLRQRKVDIAFTRAKVAVFVDGCFWHACPDHATWPTANADWWRAKLQANVARDRETDRRLRDLGWSVVRVWEHETPAEGAARVAIAVRQRA